MEETSSFEYRLLLQDEHAASEAVRHMREEHPENRAEITRREGLEAAVKRKKREHLTVCLECIASWEESR